MNCARGEKYANGMQVKKERSRSRSPQRNDMEHLESKHYKCDIKSEKVDKKIDNVRLGAKNRLKSLSVQMKLGSKYCKSDSKQRLTVASAFNRDSDSEPDELPPEAKMRMKNIGRDTPTSSGPKSFGKTRQGFSDAKKVFERSLNEAMDNAVDN